MNRRELVMGAAGLAAAGTAFALEPRQVQNLLGNRQMSAVLPAEFANWTSQGDDGLVRPETQGKLASRLYSELVSRIYMNHADGEEIMMLVAYGKTQSDLLQLHRPESCYPAVGFSLALAEEAPIPLPGGLAIPARRVVAERFGRRESIVYWVRLGEYLPANASDQRLVVLQTSMQGFIPDGALFRFSSVRDDEKAFEHLDSFIAGLVTATSPKQRNALIGSKLAAQFKT
jgi:EpsI family protein